MTSQKEQAKEYVVLHPVSDGRSCKGSGRVSTFGPLQHLYSSVPTTRCYKINDDAAGLHSGIPATRHTVSDPLSYSMAVLAAKSYILVSMNNEIQISCRRGEIQ